MHCGKWYNSTDETFDRQPRILHSASLRRGRPCRAHCAVDEKAVRRYGKGCRAMKILKYLFVALALVFWFAFLCAVLGDALAKLVMVIMLFIIVWRMAAKNKRRQLMEMSDGDSNPAEGVVGLPHDNELMPVLVGGILVYEVDEIAVRLKNGGVRFVVERDSEDRSFVYGGHGGTGTLMRIRVNQADCENALKILGGPPTTE